MQIVRDLGGYTLGRSDLVRRAMSKKKGDVMEKERKNFVYGNPEEGVPGCAANGIDADTANGIYDSMIDFAKYAFNKSHATAYAVVSFQTAWLKYYYPVEYMAALMTSVIDNPGKVAGYILTCKQMKIDILPPDINKSSGKFSVEDGKIRYGLSAIKGIGRPVMKAVEAERERGGNFTDLKDFCERLTAKEVNKRTVENFIKAGAFDGTGANRRQLMMVYAQIIDEVQQEKKSSMTGQMTLFDIMSEEEKKDYYMHLPNVPDFEKEEKLAYEKEVLGIYISGHPLEKYESVWRSGITALTTDFALDEETNEPIVGATVSYEQKSRLLTVTNADGQFQIPRNSESQLKISYIGYKTLITVPIKSTNVFTVVYCRSAANNFGFICVICLIGCPLMSCQSRASRLTVMQLDQWSVQNVWLSGLCLQRLPLLRLIKSPAVFVI